MSESKRKRVVLSIHQKLELIGKVENGSSVKTVSLDYGVGEQTVRDLLKKKDQLLKFASASDSAVAMKDRKTMKNSTYEDLDKAMLDWISQQRAQGKPINGLICAEKANMFFQQLGLEGEFHASSGWFKRFKQRHGIRELELPVAECKNRWASIRDTFPERTEPIRKKRIKHHLDGSYTQSMYEPANERLLGNASAETTSSHLMPLANSTWPVDYANFPDHRPDPEPNIHFPEIKLEVDSFDEEDNKDVYDPTSVNGNCDFSYIVPNSPYEVATDEQPTVSTKRTPAESEVDVVSVIKSKQQRQEPSSSKSSELVAVTETEGKSPEHPIETFFKSMAATVLTFPPHLMAVAKLNVCRLITELELRALTEKNHFDAIQGRMDEMLSENILETCSTSSVPVENGATK